MKMSQSLIYYFYLSYTTDLDLVGTWVLVYTKP